MTHDEAIEECRARIPDGFESLLADMPSLKPEYEALVVRAYVRGKMEGIVESMQNLRTLRQIDKVGRGTSIPSWLNLFNPFKTK